MSVKTPVFGFDTPVLGEEANVPADLLSLAVEVEAILKAHEVKYLKTAGAGDDKKLLIVGATGEPAWRAMSGDATISNLGAITIANEAVTAAKILALTITEAKLANESVGTGKLVNLAVTAAKLAAEAVETAKIKNLAVTEGKLAELAVSTAKIANLAVTEGKLADGAVSSRKFKPTAGFVQSTASMTLAGGEVDVTGASVVLNVPVESRVIVNAMWDAFIETSPVGQVEINGRIVLDAFAQFSSQPRLIANKVAPLRSSLFMTHLFTLTAGEHTIKLTTSTTKAAEAVAKVPVAQFTYMVMV